MIFHFPTRELRQTNAGEMEYNDKMDLKRNYRELGVRVVPRLWRATAPIGA